MIAQIQARVRADISRLEALPLGESIPGILFEAAREAPDAVALNFFEDGVTLTYADFARRVRRLALALAGQGVTPGSVVGVMIPNRPEFPVAWLAITALRAVMIPVNTSYTAREVKFVLQQGGASHLLIESELLERLSATPFAEVFQGQVVTVGGDGGRYPDLAALTAAVPAEAAEAFRSEAGPDDLANIQFTSGSTGMPKGCRQTHRFWLEVSLVMAQLYLPAHRRVLVHQTLFYMDPQFLLLAALRNRGTAFIARRPSSSRFFDWVEQNRIEFLFLPEFIYKQTDFTGRSFPSVKRAMIFGWGAENHIEAEARLGFPLREGFGMTEIGMATYLPEEATGFVGKKSCGLIGPFRDCKVMVSPEREAAPDETGELWVRGAGVIAAYHDNPTANANSFHDGWFRTGDLVSRDAEGFFYYQGRLKDMIRRSGENIAAQEVEAVLRTAGPVIEASVVPVKDLARGEEVKAFLTCKPGIELKRDPATLKAILETCAAGLAPFKIPRYLEQIEVFPRTGSNKIAKEVLKAARKGQAAEHYDRAQEAWVPVEG